MSTTNSKLQSIELVTNGEANYKIVYTDYYNNLNKHSDTRWNDDEVGFMQTKARELAETLNSLTGCTFECIPESEKTDDVKAIIVGKSNRITDTYFDYYQYGVHVKNGDIYIYGHHIDAIVDAINGFVAHVSENSERNLVCDGEGIKWDNLAVKYDIPLPEGLEYEGVYATSNSGDYFVYENCSKADFDAYCETLKTAGFVAYFTRQAAENHFAGFRKGDDAAWIYYINERAELRIVFEKYQPLPDLALVGAKSEDACLTQYGFKYKPNDVFAVAATGTSYVIKLEDGSFAIIDGGGAGEAANKEGAAELYNYLVANNKRTDGRVVISAWFITHAHSDHFNICKTFGDMYGTEVDCKYFIFNQPTVLTMVGSANSGSYSRGVGPDITGLIKTVASKYKNAITYITHTGCAFDMGGVFVEVMSTYEDLYNPLREKHPKDPCMPNAVDEFNDNSMTFRLYFNKGKDDEATAFFLGDVYFEHGERLASMWKPEYMKSDIVQAAHHGYRNGAISGVVDSHNPLRSSTYDAIKAEYCLWTQSYYHWTRSDAVRELLEKINPKITYYCNCEMDGTALNSNFMFNGKITVTIERRV